MRKSSLVRTLMLLAAAAASAACGAGSSASKEPSPNAAQPKAEVAVGTPFISEEGRFKVTLPAGFAPFREKKNEATRMTGYTSAGPNNTACNVSYSQFSDALAGQLDNHENLDKALGAMRDNSVMGMGGIPDREEKITVQGHPGLSVYGTIPNADATAYFRMDNVIANSRGYRFGCLSTNRDELDKPEVQAFFKSFQLTQ
jgi:hypothetical protein